MTMSYVVEQWFDYTQVRISFTFVVNNYESDGQTYQPLVARAVRKVAEHFQKSAMPA